MKLQHKFKEMVGVISFTLPVARMMRHTDSCTGMVMYGQYFLTYIFSWFVKN
jgi:hypothetical protein